MKYLKNIVNFTKEKLEDQMIQAMNGEVSVENLSIVKSLLRFNIDPNITNKERMTPLIWASKNNNVEIVKLLSRKYKSRNSKKLLKDLKDESNMTALMCACKNSNIEIVKLLIELGANLDRKGPYGKTAMMFVSGKNKMVILKLLLDNAADVFIEDDHDNYFYDYLSSTEQDFIDNNYPNESSVVCYFGSILHVIKYLISGTNEIKKNRVLSSIKYLIRNKKVGKKDDQGRNAIMLLCSYKDFMRYQTYGIVDLFKWLIKSKKIDINEQDKNGKTALMIATESNNHQLGMELLKAGADTDKQDKDGKTALMYAAERIFNETNLNFYDNQPYRIIKFDDIGIELLKADADIDKQDKDGKTALMYAYIHENYLFAEILLDYGADVNIKNDKQENVLLMILSSPYIREKDAEFIELFLKSGSDIEYIHFKEIFIYSIYNMEKYYYKSGYRYLTTLSLLSRYLSESVADGDLELVNFIIDMNIIHRESVDISVSYIDNFIHHDKQDNWTDFVSNTKEIFKAFMREKGGASMEKILLTASSRGNKEIVKTVIEKGVNLSSSYYKSISPLHVAISGYSKFEFSIKPFKDKEKILEDYLEIIKLLIEAGADVNIKNKEGETPLILSYITFNIEIHELLIKSGANLNEQDKNGYTALMWSSCDSNVELTKLLIKEGADLDMQNNDGDTALIIASRENIREIIKLLIDNNADVSIRNKEGKDFWDCLPSSFSKEEITKYIKQKKI